MTDKLSPRKYASRRSTDIPRRTLSSLSTSSVASSKFSSKKVDSRPPIVIEIGTRLTRVGFAGEYVPREIFRSEYADSRQAPLPLWDKARRPEEQHVILVKFLKDIMFKKLLSTSSGRQVVVVESLLCPTESRNALAKALFEAPALSAGSIAFVPSHLMCTLPFNTKNALVVDVGAHETVLLPVSEGVVMLSNWECTPASTLAVEDAVTSLMLKKGRVRIQDGSLRPFAVSDLQLFRKLCLAEDICFRFCFVTTRQRGLRLQANLIDDSAPIDEPPPDVEVTFGTEMLVIPGYIREVAAECLFERVPDSASLPEAILKCVQRLPIDLRRSFLRNLLLTGGMSRMKGLLSRLKSELLDLCHGKFGQLTAGDIAFYRFGDDICSELYLGWLGGSMFGSLDCISNRSFTREEWLEQKSVPDWTNKIDDYRIPPNVSIKKP
ncbi:actin [Aphelenchoides avenae]|nr:actin [Aphelenchus avenae]